MYGSKHLSPNTMPSIIRNTRGHRVGLSSVIPYPTSAPTNRKLVVKISYFPSELLQLFTA